MSPAPFAPLGSVSTDTLRPEDLISAFASELAYLTRRVSEHPRYAELVSRAHALLETDEPADDALLEMIDELCEALECFAPPYCYFGAHPDDGADFGFWPEPDFQRMMRDDDVLQVAGLADIPADFRGDVLLINDHGNCTFGTIDDTGEFVEAWSCV